MSDSAVADGSGGEPDGVGESDVPDAVPDSDDPDIESPPDVDVDTNEPDDVSPTDAGADGGEPDDATPEDADVGEPDSVEADAVEDSHVDADVLVDDVTSEVDEDAGTHDAGTDDEVTEDADVEAPPPGWIDGSVDCLCDDRDLRCTRTGLCFADTRENCTIDNPCPAEFACARVGGSAGVPQTRCLPRLGASARCPVEPFEDRVCPPDMICDPVGIDCFIPPYCDTHAACPDGSVCGVTLSDDIVGPEFLDETLAHLSEPDSVGCRTLEEGAPTEWTTRGAFSPMCQTSVDCAADSECVWGSASGLYGLGFCRARERTCGPTDIVMIGRDGQVVCVKPRVPCVDHADCPEGAYCANWSAGSNEQRSPMGISACASIVAESVEDGD